MPDRRTPPMQQSASYWHSVPDGPTASSDLVLRLARERDHLFLLHETSAAAERVVPLDAKLRIFLSAVLRVGFHRGTISVRDAKLEQTLLVASGLTPDEEMELRERASPGAVWRRRLEQLEPYRVSESYYLDARDPWIAQEFGNAVPSSLSPRDGGDWSPRDALLVPLRGRDGRLVGTLSLDDPVDRARPTVEQVRTVELYAAQIAIAIERVHLQEERDREQRLSGALSDVARAVNESLKPAEVHQLIVRHARAVLKCDGAALSLLQGDMVHCVAGAGSGTAFAGLHIPVAALTAQAIRTGMAAMSNDYGRSPDRDPNVLRVLQPRRVLVVPLVSRTGPIGVLTAVDRDAPFTENDAEFLQRMGEQVAMAVVNATLFDEVAGLAERYRGVVETTRDAIVITDRERRITFTNPAADALFALPPGTHASVEILVPEELRESVRAHEASALAGVPQRYESAICRPEGGRRLVAVSSAPLHEHGEITGIVATLRDITDERTAQDALAQSEARYRNLFETATDAIYTLDAVGVFTSANDTTCAMLGVAREELVGRSVRPLLVGSEYEWVKAHFHGALNGEPRRYECHFVRPDGVRRLVSVTNTPIRDGDRVIGVLGIARDVTAERDRETALARSQARYTRLVESASDGIFTTDLEGRFTSVNRALEQAAGRVRTSLAGERFVDLVEEEDRRQIAELLREAAAGTRCHGRLRYRSADGELRHGSLLATPVYEGGELTGVLGIVRDVTDERRLAEQLLQQEKLAAVGELVSGVAHELNNPLAGVVAFSQLLLAGDAPPDRRRAIESIHTEARRASRIVSSLLTFARQHQPERTLTDLNRILEETLELRRYALRNHGITVELQLDQELPLTWADPHQLQQVVVNLLVNAEHALAEWEGRRAITLSTSRTDGLLLLRIADTGPGISPEHLSRVFNPFFTTKGVGKGTGLGLSISHGIVHEHGGRITVESRPGAGATFTVELPFVAPPLRAPQEPVPAQEPLVSGKRMLVVDDEAAIRLALTGFFRSLGYVVDGAASGSEALTLVERTEYDAILLDLRMPDMNGDVVYMRLHARTPALAERVVFITGDIQGDPARRFIQATGRPIVMKPFLLDDLAAIVAAAANAAPSLTV